MSLVALATFDLGGASQDDYNSAYGVLIGLGFQTVMEFDPNCPVDPTTMMIMKAAGLDPWLVQRDLLSAISKGFQAKGLVGEVFVVVGKEVAVGGYKVVRQHFPAPSLFPR